MYRQAGIDRSLIVAWNVVPWYIGTTRKIRATTTDDVTAAQPYLARLLDLLPDLRVVVAVGNTVRDGWLRFLLRDGVRLVPTLWCPHPSPRNLNTRPESRDQILAAFTRVARICEPD